MKQAINDKLGLFTNNASVIRKDFVWLNVMAKRLVALICTLENKPIDCIAIKENLNLIKNNTGLFSMFRGNMSLCIAAMLSLNTDRDKVFANTISVYDQLNLAKFGASDYLAVAAYLIACNTEPYNYQHAVRRTRAFYEGMKKHRWFHTGQDDYIFTSMLGLSDVGIEEGLVRINLLYEQLKPEFRLAGGGGVQMLAQMLAICGKCNDSLEHLFHLRHAFRQRNVRLDKAYTLPALGALSLLDISSDILVNDMLDAQRYLRAQKGFSSFSITTQELLLYTSAIISSVYAVEMKSNIVASLTTSITSIIIAQQIAIVIAASTT